ncbi:hypothetical protein EAH78_10020 [Pseudomonas arsenicoxydans]|uniref:Uncharacterized protein n=1 Tax=Pseudomonas arsenicoxydans TaxID=702115 RepID=A0A502I0W0_9PSED|nr:hypothetical protein EAH78_10020 [Pseudomonas arsenicoxydans]
MCQGGCVATFRASSRASPLPHSTELFLANALKCGSGLAREGAGTFTTKSGYSTRISPLNTNVLRHRRHKYRRPWRTRP